VSIHQSDFGGQESKENALVFFQHLYYLRVPFVSGHPNNNLNIDPRSTHSEQPGNLFFSRKHSLGRARSDYPL